MYWIFLYKAWIDFVGKGEESIEGKHIHLLVSTDRNSYKQSNSKEIKNESTNIWIYPLNYRAGCDTQ